MEIDHRLVTYFVGFLNLLKFFPCIFVRVSIWMKFTSELFNELETFPGDELGNRVADVQRNKFSSLLPQLHPF